MSKIKRNIFAKTRSFTKNARVCHSGLAPESRKKNCLDSEYPEKSQIFRGFQNDKINSFADFSRKTLQNESGKIFAKVMFASLLIFAFSFTAWLNFRGIPADTAKATDTPTETIRPITADDGGDPWIQFNTRRGYVDTGVDPVGDIQTEIDFQYSPNVGYLGSLFGAVSASDGSTASGNYRIYKVGDGFLFEYGDFLTTVNWFTSPTNDLYDRMMLATDNDKVLYNDEVVLTSTGPGPTVPINMYLGNANVNGAPTGGNGFVGKIYYFKIWKAGELVRNFRPAARYTCGEQSSLEYGFVSDLNGDGAFTDDEWFGNLGGGTLTGSEEITVPACPVAPETPEPTAPTNPPEIPDLATPVAKPTGKNSVGAPNTGFAK